MNPVDLEILQMHQEREGKFSKNLLGLSEKYTNQILNSNLTDDEKKVSAASLGSSFASAERLKDI